MNKGSRDLGYRVAHLVSLVLSPQIYGGLIALILWSNYRLGGYEALVMLILTQSVLPLAPIVYDTWRGVTDIFISEREKRFRYFLFTLLSYIIGMAYLELRGYHEYMLLYVSYFLIGLVFAVITFKWKISVHAAGIAGPTTVAVLMLGALYASLYLLLLPVAWARLRMRAHTFCQIVGGSTLSILLTAVIYYAKVF